MFYKPSKRRDSFRTLPRLPSYRLVAALALILVVWTAPVEATTVAPPNRLEELRAQELRVARVTYRLALANKTFCTQASSPQAGFVLHGIEQYEVADRERVTATFRLGSHLGVMAVVPHSPVERAGLKADDQLLTVNGKALRGEVLKPDRAPTRTAVQGVQEIFIEEMKKGEVTLGIIGAQGRREIRFTPEPGCTSNVELLPGEAVNAWADGERVVIGAGLLARCKTDADLALVIAHELAHNLLRHSHWLTVVHGPHAKKLGLRGSGPVIMREAEEEADRLAVRLTIAAAYDVSGAEAFLSGLLDDRESAADSGTHPETARRLGLLRAAIAVAQGV